MGGTDRPEVDSTPGDLEGVMLDLQKMVAALKANSLSSWNSSLFCRSIWVCWKCSSRPGTAGFPATRRRPRIVSLRCRPLSSGGSRTHT